MQIDKAKLTALAHLDDREFGEIIYKALKASGAGEAAARSAMNAAPIIKSKLKNASDKDIDRIVSFIGERTASDILGGMGK